VERARHRYYSDPSLRFGISEKSQCFAICYLLAECEKAGLVGPAFWMDR
jgi:hypothetical protein